ncbi:MAG: ATP synthase subunit I [Deltaproteobacteria bacterium]
MEYRPAVSSGAAVAAAGAASKVLLYCLVAGLFAASLAWIWKGAHAGAGIAAGFAVGTLNSLWLVSIARRAVGLTSEKAGRFVLVRYQLRFAVTAVIFFILVAWGVFSPWALVAGLSGSLVATITAMIRMARKEASKDA